MHNLCNDHTVRKTVLCENFNEHCLYESSCSQYYSLPESLIIYFRWILSNFISRHGIICLYVLSVLLLVTLFGCIPVVCENDATDVPGTGGKTN